MMKLATIFAIAIQQAGGVSVGLRDDKINDIRLPKTINDYVWWREKISHNKSKLFDNINE